MSIFDAIFTYGFMRNALAAGLLVAVCAALLGVPLVLKRFSMIGDGLSHVGFGAMAVALAMNAAPLAISIPVVIISAFLMLRISGNTSIGGDAIIALISSSSIAVGVLVTSVTSGLNVDVYSYMFGSIFTVTTGDIWLAAGLAAAVIGLYILFFDKLFIVTFDENFAAATGINVEMYNTVIALLTAVTVVVGMRLMGTLLISSVIIFPALTSMRLFRSFKSVVICSACVAAGSFLIGLFLSFGLHTPTAATVVIVNLLAFAAFALLGKASKMRKQKAEGRNN